MIIVIIVAHFNSSLLLSRLVKSIPEPDNPKLFIVIRDL